MSEVGDDGIDDDNDGDGDSDNEVEVFEAVYFRLLTTVGVPLVSPLVWQIDSSTCAPLTLRFLDGSGVSLRGIFHATPQHRTTATREG